ncbi:hypothetical protein RHGRI_004535 [Rhododendron griersonianum]|uniref:Uncharacterized protein n=1 Tax=Rhododendron griersonianum TaxID=479676 RepID=A0AAV6L9X3_9ERIC|nr:hypothetical protein RHGRI_004535 [Rhododendron griersonianum]
MGDHLGWAPTGSPLLTDRDDGHWRHFDNSVNALSFGFVATAVLISMFLFMAIFEKFLRPNSPESSPEADGRRRNRQDVESQLSFNGKLRVQSPKVANHKIVRNLDVIGVREK